MKKYYYIDKRNAWDTVRIGLFQSYEEAKKNLNWNWGEELIKEANKDMINNFLNK